MKKKSLTKSSSESTIADVDHAKHVSFCTCQDSESVSGAIDNLYFNCSDQEDTMSLTNSKSVETYRFENRLGFKTYEIPSLRVVVQGPEILNFQGTKHSPDEIAVYWKKDSRTWLWKSGNSAYRRKSKLKARPNTFFKM